ncbi:arginase [Methylobacterium platani]|uniref:Arginase n=2 Tax=Methylobacterium platani TaxID=427683 RepID=A0A179RYZ0_9HYPH|nr:arginase [Methylobacterium platani]KMO17867.1 arginase [Methylobacterium platani JCM 14648]OAS15955.1 arginase [Methylobacterium platani]
MAGEFHEGCVLVGAPVQSGTDRLGCDMGPSAYRAAGLGQAIRDLGIAVEDAGTVAPTPFAVRPHPNPAVHHLAETAGWTLALTEAAYRHSEAARPIFLGGDHSLSAGTVAGMSLRARAEGRPLFLLWLDAHADLHTLDTTTSGNLHGVPLAYLTGRPGFAGYFPPLDAGLDPARICMIGLRSVDPAERALLAGSGTRVHDMRDIDETGIVAPLRDFLGEVAAADGLLHVSLDVDFLDPGIAPGVGTTVPGGATFREAHLIMELLHDSGLVRSLDLVELNPFLDERGRTALLMADLAASLFGRRILDRPTRSF